MDLGERSDFVHYLLSDYDLPASSDSPALLVRSWERPFSGRDCEEGALSERPSVDWEGAAFVAEGPTGEEGLASRWSRAFKAIALRKKIVSLCLSNKLNQVPPSFCLCSCSSWNLRITTLFYIGTRWGNKMKSIRQRVYKVSKEGEGIAGSPCVNQRINSYWA